MQCLGVDIGSTSIKGAVLDVAGGGVREMVTRPFPAPHADLPPGWIEIDPAAVCAKVDEVLSALLRAAPTAARLYCSGQMGGVILIDENVRPLTNYISWRDQRTVEPAASHRSLLDTIRDKWQSTGVFGELGSELQAGSTTPLLAWLAEHDRLPEGSIPTTIADFVLGRLTGAPLPMHVTNAAGMLRLSDVAWHRTAFEQIGLRNVKLPELSYCEEAVGSATLGGRRLQIFGSYGDQQCALRGAQLSRDELSLNISTGSQISRRSSAFMPGDYVTRKYFFDDYLDTVTHLPAGRSLNALVHLLTELARAEGIELHDVWETIHRAVIAVESNELEVDLAFFPGPLGDRGAISGITVENLSVGHLFHAAFRSMADNYARIACRFPQASWSEAVLSGGMSRSAPTLRQLLVDRFPVPLRESPEEETLLGLLDVAKSHSSHAT